MGYFVFKKTNTGVKFDLVAGNHEVIATSEVYKSDASCKKGIASVRRNAPIANVEDKTVEPVVVKPAMVSYHASVMLVRLPLSQNGSMPKSE